jgi:hypothetical protein
MNQVTKWTLAAAVAFAAMGCQPTEKPRLQQSRPVVFQLPPSREAAAAVLQPLVKQFNDDCSAFPGTSGAEHRETLVIVLADLTKILGLINGPDQSPGFTTDLAIIDSSRKTADIQSIPRARMEAVENESLQATSAALNELATRYLLDKDQLPGLLDALTTKVAAAANVQGPMHDIDATEAFKAVQAVVQRMNDDLQSMVSTPTPTPEMPATPITPATMPATVPATMP